MIVLMSGSRDWTDRKPVETAYDELSPSLVIHGDANGLDAIAHAVAMSRGIDVGRFPANWNGRGKSAGMFRNALMHDLIPPDVLCAFPLPQSRGTIGMINYARSKGTAVLVWDHINGGWHES